MRKNACHGPLSAKKSIFFASITLNNLLFFRYQHTVTNIETKKQVSQQFEYLIPPGLGQIPAGIVVGHDPVMVLRDLSDHGAGNPGPAHPV